MPDICCVGEAIPCAVTCPPSVMPTRRPSHGHATTSMCRRLACLDDGCDLLLDFAVLTALLKEGLVVYSFVVVTCLWCIAALGRPQRGCGGVTSRPVEGDVTLCLFFTASIQREYSELTWPVQILWSILIEQI